jgi:hypothetical protein
MNPSADASIRSEAMKDDYRYMNVFLVCSGKCRQKESGCLTAGKNYQTGMK